jgi:hypothetical protein
LTCLLSASVGNAVSRVVHAMAVFILKSNQSTLAGRWRCVAGAFDGSGGVHHHHHHHHPGSGPGRI